MSENTIEWNLNQVSNYIIAYSHPIFLKCKEHQLLIKKDKKESIQIKENAYKIF